MQTLLALVLFFSGQFCASKTGLQIDSRSDELPGVMTLSP